MGSNITGVSSSEKNKTWNRSKTTIEEGVVLKITEEILNGKSLREVSESYGLGRNRVRRAINQYYQEDGETLSEIDRCLNSRRYNKKTGEIREELTTEQVKTIYARMKEEHKSVYTIADEIGRSPEYLSRKILEGLETEEERQEFLTAKSTDLKDISEITKEMIYIKLNDTRTKEGKTAYPIDSLNEKYDKLKTIFSQIKGRYTSIDEVAYRKMLFDTPSLLASSVENRIIPALENLKKSDLISEDELVDLLKGYSGILINSIPRTNLQFKILSDNKILRKTLSKPKTFMTSPELMYALIEHAKSKDAEGWRDKGIRRIFKTRNILEQEDQDLSFGKLRTLYPLEKDRKYEQEYKIYKEKRTKNGREG